MFHKNPLNKNLQDNSAPNTLNSTERGRLAEAKAADFLSEQGVEIHHRNFRIKGGEIDLIGLDGNTLVFVEVRLRRRQDFGGAISTVDWHKQRKIILTAHYFLTRHGHAYNQLPCRFDCIFIEGFSQQVHWIKNAFEADGR